MGLNLDNIQPGKRYTFTGIVNQTGMGKQTERPTRMLYELKTEDIVEQHTWLTYDDDVCRFRYRHFGDIIGFTAEAYIYDKAEGKVGIYRLEGIKHLGRVDMDKIKEMCLVKDKGKSAKNHGRLVCAEDGKTIYAYNKMHFGFSTKGTEMHFCSTDCRKAYMERVFG